MLFRSDRKSTRLNSSHLVISYAVFCLKKKKSDPAASSRALGPGQGAQKGRNRKVLPGPRSRRSTDRQCPAVGDFLTTCRLKGQSLPWLAAESACLGAKRGLEPGPIAKIGWPTVRSTRNASAGSQWSTANPGASRILLAVCGDALGCIGPNPRAVNLVKKRPLRASRKGVYCDRSLFLKEN